MTSREDEVRAEIDRHNEIRREAGLPSVDVDVEVASAKEIRDQREFEDYFQRRRSEFVHIWAGGGFLTGVGLLISVRRQLIR